MTTLPPSLRFAPLRLRTFSNATVTLAASLLAFAPFASAQAIPAEEPNPPAAADSDPRRDETIVLNPFEVSTSEDNSYGALQSNSLTAFRMDLVKMPATASVFTETFMDDVAATSVEQMLVAYSGVVGYNPNNVGAALDMSGDRNGGQGLGIRGLQASEIKRDGFLGPKNSARTATGNSDSFSIERVELIEGPQSLMYGAVGGGGVINSVSKQARFNQAKASLRFTLDQYGSKRGMFDYNVGSEKFAVRVAAVDATGRTNRYNLSNSHDFSGIYTQAAFRILPGTTLRLTGEKTSNDAVFNFEPNFNPFFAPGDPRIGQNTRYLALTGQLADLDNVTAGGVDFENYSSFAGWWQHEKIDNEFTSLSIESTLGAGFSLKLTGIYSETKDSRTNSVGKALLPAGMSGNPFNETAVRVSFPGDNWQSDRTKGVQAVLLHEADFSLFGIRGRSQTAAGLQGFHQGPAFGSSGIDHRYYQADENWNVIINPALTQDYGRVPLSEFYYPVGSGIPLQAGFRPGSDRVTFNGVNYIRMPRIFSDPSRATADNPFGLIPNNPTSSNPNGFSGNWNRGGDTHDRLYYFANFTDWADGKITTMAGISVDRFTTTNVGPNRVTFLPARNYDGYQVGVNYRIDQIDGLRVYATVSSAGMSAGTTRDYYGEPLKVPQAKAPTPEVGFKYASAGGRFFAQFAYNFTTEVENETRNAGSDFFNAVNPNGINGRFNGGDQWINVDRESNSAELVITANPTRAWRMRLAATKIDGEITSTVRYDQLYNDQFYTSGNAITYGDGAPVLVDPAGGGGTPTTPLTIDMLNDPTNPYYADPHLDSGSITNSTLVQVLTTPDPVHGVAATGATGLPLSAIQYNFDNPHNGTITVVEEGDKNTGFNEYSFNFQNSYSFLDGPLNGLSVFVDVQSTHRNRAYYTSYFPESGGNALQARRELYRLPSLTTCGVGLSYKLQLPGRLNRIAWTTQLNVRNVFDNSEVWVVPNPANGANLNARLSADPRLFLWTNTISF